MDKETFERLMVALIAIALLMAIGIYNAKADHGQIHLKKTTDGTEFTVEGDALEGTEAEKEFFKTGKNIYVGDPVAAKKGRRIYNLWSCTACHGKTAKGQVGPGLTGPNYNYAKNETDKGMFETIFHGTHGGMGAKGFGYLTEDDGLTADDILQVISFVRSNAK